ncbi:uncharacterized protein A4U43_C09F600 [Asparagus officinalis]|uniref:Uncharacterized protein n=1 Tax=Asparagus officinalis TaxID=4686 RepID=A0A5P1E921_ASPOF|nr:uncharacterized protein LOC109824301 [Asparagus officinalis]ONK57446.1 uncharacterized protein A4U43_C09F600 [Asparagus officinalis]
MSVKRHNAQEKKDVDDGGGGRSTVACDLQAPATGQPVRNACTICTNNAFGGGSCGESNIPFTAPAPVLIDMNDGRWRGPMMGPPPTLGGGWGGWRGGGGGGGGHGVDIGSGNYGAEGNDVIIRNVLGSISNISESTQIGSHNISDADNAVHIDLSADHHSRQTADSDAEGTREAKDAHHPTSEP